MVKKILIITIVALLSGYLGFAWMYPKKTKEDVLCKDIEIEIVDKKGNSYLDAKEIGRLLRKAGVHPEGKNLSEINTGKIEAALKEDNLVKNAECYKTVNGNIKLKIYPRTPLLRIFTAAGSYYIDTEGEKMPVPANFSAYLPIASGFIEDDFAKTKLYAFALFLQKDKFWNAQIEQIYVAQNQDIELTPRVGNHQIVLGKIEDGKANLDKLKFFYEEGLNKVGWNRYSKINLKYENQVVCTRIE